MKFSREGTTWGSYDGRNKKVKDLDNDHLLNIIHHIRKLSDYYHPELLALMVEEARLRNLDPNATALGQIPFQNSNGDWVLWDYSVGGCGQPKKIA